MRVLGIDLGTWSVKAVEMESRFRKFEILDFHEQRLPLQAENWGTVYRSALDALLSKLPTHPDKIVVGLNPSQVSLKFLVLPLRQKKKIEQSYLFELEDQVPFRMEDTAVEHTIFRHPVGSLVVAAVVPKSILSQQVDWFKSLGLDPDWICFDGMGTANAYIASFEKEKDQEKDKAIPSSMVIDLGHSKTNLFIFRERRLEFFRSVLWGGATLNRAIADQLKIGLEAAEEKKHSILSFVPSEAELPVENASVISAASQCLRPLLTEILHFLSAYRSQNSDDISQVYLTGGSAQVAGFSELLAEQLKKPVLIFQPKTPSTELREPSPEKSSRFVEALGRAESFSRRVSFLLNFRRGEFAKSTSLTEVNQILKNPVTLRVLKFGSLLTGILFLYAFTATVLVQWEMRQTQEELRKTVQDTFQGIPPKVRLKLTSDPNELRKFIEQKKKELDQKLKLTTKNRTPILGLIKSISDSVPTSVKMDIANLSLDEQSLIMEGTLQFGNLQEVVETLKKSPKFKDITLQVEGQRFTLRGKITGR